MQQLRGRDSPPRYPCPCTCVSYVLQQTQEILKEVEKLALTPCSTTNLFRIYNLIQQLTKLLIIEPQTFYTSRREEMERKKEKDRFFRQKNNMKHSNRREKQMFLDIEKKWRQNLFNGRNSKA